MTRLDDNRARSLLAGKLGVPVTAVEGTIIWGNHSNTQYPDLDHARVGDLSAQEIKEQLGQEYIAEYIKVNKWI